MLHQSKVPQHDGAVPDTILVASKELFAFPRVPVTQATPLTQTIFCLAAPVKDRRRAAHSLFEIGRLFSLFSCLSLVHLLILLLLLMSINVHFNPGSVFLCSVCAANVTWRGRSVQCCTCSRWIHLRCSLLSFSRFKTLGSSYSWICPPCCDPASSGCPSHTNTLSSSSSLYNFTVQPCPSASHSADPALPPHLRLQTSYPPSTHSVSPPSAFSRRLVFLAAFLYLLLFFP